MFWILPVFFFTFVQTIKFQSFEKTFLIYLLPFLYSYCFGV